MQTSSKPALARLVTDIDSAALPHDVDTVQLSTSPFLAAQMTAVADNPHRGRVPQGSDDVTPLAHQSQRTDAYKGFGFGVPPSASPQDSPSERVATPDEILHSRPILIESCRQSEEGQTAAAAAAASPVGLSPAMQFLHTMNSPVSLSASTSPAPSCVTASSLSPIAREPEYIGPYALGPVIASGGFSVIRKATSPTGVVAIKVISTASAPPGSPALALLEQEISIWAGLHHEYVLPLIASYRSPTAIYLATLLCPEGSLLDVLRLHGRPGLAQDDAGTLFRQIVRGLRYLHHDARIVHGDIKLENILLDELGTCRIADFGLARPITDTPPPVCEKQSLTLTRSDSIPSTSTLPPHLRGRRPARRASSYVPAPPAAADLFASAIAPGSLPYAAPELLVQRAGRGGIGHIPRPAQDVWALGCVLHALLYGRLPFADAYEPRLVDKILAGRWCASPPTSSRSKSRSRSHWRRSRSRGARCSSRRDDGAGVHIGAGAKRVLRGCLLVDPATRWTIAQVHEVAWNVGWGEHDMDETEIIVEQPLPPPPPPPPSTSRDEQDGWETVDDDVDAEAAALTRSTSTMASSLPALSPTRPRSARDEDGPRTPVDEGAGDELGGEQALLRPQPPQNCPGPKRVRLGAFRLDVVGADPAGGM